MVVLEVMRAVVRRRRGFGALALLVASCGGLTVERVPSPESGLAGSGGVAGRDVGGRGGGDRAGASATAGGGGKAGETAMNGGEAGMGGAVSEAGASGDDGAAGESWVVDEDPPYSGPTVVELRLGAQHSCARLADDTIQCWGKDVKVFPDPDGGSTEDGIVTWPAQPAPSTGLPEPPGGTFTALTYGTGFGCGLRLNGSIECWGYAGEDPLSPPEGAYSLIAAGSAHACAFSSARGVVCWGNDDGFQASPPAAISAGNSGYVRVATGGGGVLCSGTWQESEEESGVPGGAWGYDPYPRAATACGLKADGRLDCFGSGSGGIAPRKEFLDVSVSGWATCGVTPQGVECWGDDVDGASQAGDFVQVSTSVDYTCVLDAEQELTCWAPLPGGTPLTVPSGPFRRVVVGGGAGCDAVSHISALRSDGNVVTWKPDAMTGAVAQEFEVEGPFKDLTADHEVTCAIQASGSSLCWSPSRAPDPTEQVPGDLERVVGGFGQGCQLHTDGSVSCSGGLGRWDTDDFIFVDGAQEPGPFIDLAMGSDYACGVLAEGGGIKCWGTHVR